jgi:hypothetical protein
MHTYLRHLSHCRCRSMPQSRPEVFTYAARAARHTASLSARAIAVVRVGGLVVLATPPLAHPASLRPRGLSEQQQHSILALSCLSRPPPPSIYLHPTISHPRNIALHPSVLPVCVLACLHYCHCPALHQPIFPACLRSACISIPHQHPPVPTITPARLPERA